MNPVRETITESSPGLPGVARDRVVNPARPATDSRGKASQQSQRIQELIERIDTTADLKTRELVQECLHSVLAFYGDGLARMLELTARAGVEGTKVRETFLRDKLVSSLLLIHGLHPLGLEARLRAALDKIRPYLQSHGGNVELLALENDVATLQLQGTCKSCPASSMTLELAVRQVIEEACPDLARFEVMGVSQPANQSAPGPCVATT